MAASGEHRGMVASSAAVPAVALGSGKPMPRVGLGTASFPLGEDEARPHVREAVLLAMDAGFRHFDTAAVYGTEVALGDATADAVRAGTIRSRDDLYITSKLWIADAHPDGAMDMKGVWEEMEVCHRRGLAKAIGVSNFSCKKLQYVLSFANIPPAANQVEVNPYCRQNKLREFCKEKGIQLCAYSPLGGNGTPWGNSFVLDSPVLKQIALDRGKTVAQVCMRWVYEQGDCVITKSFNETRMRENLDIFDWELTQDDHRKISALPESRGTYDFFIHESGPYKTTSSGMVRSLPDDATNHP